MRPSAVSSGAITWRRSAADIRGGRVREGGPRGPKARRAGPAAVVWQYWEEVPGRSRSAYLDLCLETVRRHAGSLDVRLLDFDGVVDLLPDIHRDVWERLPDPPARSDYARARLLERFGGLWLDADVIAPAPLEQMMSLLETTEVVGWANRDG